MPTSLEGLADARTVFCLLREACAEMCTGRVLIANPHNRLVFDCYQGVVFPVEPSRPAEDLGAALESALRWPAARYSFCAAQDVHTGKGGTTIPNLILSVVRAMENEEHVRALVGTLNGRIAPAPDPLCRFPGLDLRPQEAYVLSRIEAELSIADLCRISALPEVVTLRALLGFLATGVLEWVEDSQQGRIAAARIRPEYGENAAATSGSINGANTAHPQKVRQNAKAEPAPRQEAAASDRPAAASEATPAMLILKRHGKSAIAEKRYQSAKAALLRSDFSAALEHLREAVRLEPNVASYQHLLGKVLSRVPRRISEAIERLETAVKLEPENWEYRYALGRVYRQAGQQTSAEEQFKEALRINPNRPIPAGSGEKESILSRLLKKPKST